MLEEALKQGILPAIVVAIYLIAIRIIDSKKETEQARVNSSIVDSINNIGTFLKHVTKDILDKDKIKCQNTIRSSFYALSTNLMSFVSTTIINNHIDVNKNTILLNVKNIVNSGYYSIFSELSLYKYDEKDITLFLNKEWMKEIESDVIDTIYAENLSKEDKIIAFNNKIQLRFQTYITYLINNINQ